MRVYHLIKGLGRGGAEMLLPEVIRATPRAAAHFRVGYFLPWKDHLVGTLEETGTPVVCFGGRNNARILSQVATVARDVKRWEADVLHCHLPVSGAVGRFVGAVTGVPVVYTEHNLQERYHPLTATLNRSTWPLLEHAIACSGEVKRSIQRHIGDAVPVETVPNGVSLERFKPDPALRALKRAELGLEADAPVMGNVAIFGAQKRLREWLTLAASVRKSRPDARFLLIGDGPLRGEIEAHAKALGLGESLILPGLQSDVRPWLQAMDLYVMTSEFEGLPVALLEAMASGLVPLCTAVGGIGQVITPECGGVVEVGDWALLEAPILDLFTDHTRRAELGRAARERVRTDFSVDVMAERLLRVYGGVARA